MTATYEHKTELVGDDHTGLPTRPVQYRGAKKHDGLDWDRINADYIARDGQVDASVWPKHGKVVIVGGSANSSRANMHTFTEASEHDLPPAPKRGKKPRTKTATQSKQTGQHPLAKLTDQQRTDIGRRYQAGESLSMLSKAYSVTVTTISKTINRQGIQARRQGRPS